MTAGPNMNPIFFTRETVQKELAEKSKQWLVGLNKFDKPIATKIVKFTQFSPVQESEQHFYKKNPERYLRYRKASGRDAFIEKYWGDIYAKNYDKPSDKF